MKLATDRRTSAAWFPALLLLGALLLAVRVPADAALVLTVVAALFLTVTPNRSIGVAAATFVLVVIVVVAALEGQSWHRIAQAFVAILVAVPAARWAVVRVQTGAAGRRYGVAATIGSCAGVAALACLAPWTPSLAVGSALGEIQNRAYFASRVDWASARASAWSRLRAPTAMSSSDAVRDVLASLHDNHSYYFSLADYTGLTANRFTGFGALLVPNREWSTWFDIAYLWPDGSARAKGLRAGDVVNVIYQSATEMDVQRIRPNRLRTNLTPTNYSLYRPPVAAQLPSSIGYVEIPGFAATTAEDRRLADDSRRAIAKNVGTARCGWIVDARLNWGGSLYPMLQAVAPALRRGRFSISYDGPSGPIESVELDGGNVAVRPGAPRSAQPTNTTPRIAILTSGLTASAGESLVLALRGDGNNARTVGSRTAGAVSATTHIPVGGFGMAVVAAAVDVDSAGRSWLGAIPPDMPSSIDWSHRGGSLDDGTVRTAWTWLHGHCGKPLAR